MSINQSISLLLLLCLAFSMVINIVLFSFWQRTSIIAAAHTISIAAPIITNDTHFAFIHVGKCGGSSIWTELDKHGFHFDWIHTEKPIYSRDQKYLLVVRNPIKRFVSAFNWRYKLVVADSLPEQRERFDGEFERLTHYQTANNLAESLYDTAGALRVDFSATANYIHHLAEDINFYCSTIPFDDEVFMTENIIGVIATETMSYDMKRLFNIEITAHEKNNHNSSNYDQVLSELAYKNLKKYFWKDYQCIDGLYGWNLISTKTYHILSR